tara:strand:+ start:2715 stop:2966 length:252 start_codon:yes stop_codon:yes gene_type:complete
MRFKSQDEIWAAIEIADNSVKWWQDKLQEKEQELLESFYSGRTSDFKKHLDEYQNLSQRAEFEDRNITKIEKEIDNYGTEEGF